VARASYGMFYDLARQNAIQTGFSRTTTLVASQDTGQTYTASLANPFPNGFDQPVGASLGLMTNAGQSVTVFPNRLLNPDQQRWEAALQRSLGAAAVLEISYVGNRGTHLRIWRQMDAVPVNWLSASPVRDNVRYALLTSNVKSPFYPLLPNTSLASSTVGLAQLLRPYPGFTGVSSLSNDAFSWYHGLLARVQKRFGRNYQVLATYTWSKFMDATAFLNEGDPAPAHVISTQDRTHRLVATSVYQLPLTRSKHGWRGALLGGWQAQAIYQRQSGAPITFGNVLWYGGDIHTIQTAARTPARWFDITQFERNSAYQLVYNRRTFPLRMDGVRTMGTNLLDGGLTKSQRVGERYTVQLRADAFNVLNHTHFGAPGVSPTSTDFGVISSTSQLPRVIEFSLRVSF